jgi:hypothetical protein
MSYSGFIDSDYIYIWTIVDRNVDPDLINKFIDKAQNINIQGVLGNSLYIKLMNDFTTTGTYPGLYKTLMDSYIQPALAEWCVYHALPYINYKLTNKSVAERSSDSSQPTELDVVKYLRSDIMNNAEYLTEQIRVYILNNQTSFPEYFTYQGIENIKPSRSGYFSGIYTGKNKGYFGPKYDC